MSVAVLSPRDVPTTLNYFASTDDTQAPFNYVYELPPGEPRTNVSAEPHPVVVHDARNKESEIGLDKTGFNFVAWPSVEKDFVDDEKIKAQYYPEVEKILKTHAEGAKRVFIFDHTIRRNVADDRSTPNARGPVQRVHVDQTFVAGIERVRYHLPDEAERLLKGRVRIINVWRPIANPVAHSPLAVADYRSIVPTEDLISTRHIYQHREGSTFSVKYRPEHQWWYLSDQTPEEVTLIKCFDSEDREGTARLTPHSAFVDKSSPENAPHRQSIEVRALVFDLE